MIEKRKEIIACGNSRSKSMIVVKISFKILTLIYHNWPHLGSYKGEACSQLIPKEVKG